jgi:hypothetical protein
VECGELGPSGKKFRRCQLKNQGQHTLVKNNR